MSEEGSTRLVPGRECGECTHCCVDLAIVDDGMSKLPGIVCENCMASGGCAIYEQRPQVCRDYHCIWRELGNLDESWRPDRCGILIQWRAAAPDDFPAAHAVDLVIVGPVEETLRGDAFAGLAGGFVNSGTAVFLKVPYGPEFVAAQAFLNRVLASAVAARDYEEIKRITWALHGEMQKLPRVPATIEYFAARQSERAAEA